MPGYSCCAALFQRSSLVAVAMQSSHLVTVVVQSSYLRKSGGRALSPASCVALFFGGLLQCKRFSGLVFGYTQMSRWVGGFAIFLPARSLV